ncbi:MAG: hypothetical protein QXT57_03030 [Thermosphaera sp.]
MTLEYKVDNNMIKYCGHGIVVCYDAPTLKIREGHGVTPSVHNSIIRKLEAAGKVVRLQKSVIFVEDPSVLPLITSALERVKARYVVIEGRITGHSEAITNEKR